MNQKAVFLLRNFFIFFVLFIFSNISFAGYSVSNMNVALSPDRPVHDIIITNTEDKPLTVQITAFSLRHEKEGEEVLTKTKDLIAAPPIVTIKPKGKQIVRIVNRIPFPKETEAAYRVEVLEISSGTKTSLTREADQSGAAITFRLRFLLSAYVAPTQPTQPNTHFTLQQQDKTNWQLVLENTGNKHDKILSLVLREKETQKEIFNPKKIFSVLPKEIRHFSIQNSFDNPEKLELVVKNEGGKESVQPLKIEAAR